MNFNDYLEKQDMTTLSMESCRRIVQYFLTWLQSQGIATDQVSYTDILAYMKHCQKAGVTQRTIQHYLNMIRHLYACLIEQGQIENNPVTGIKVQGVKRKTLYHIFQPAELHALYNSFEVNTLTDKRDKVMLGLMVYQGVKTEELALLEVKDVKLKEGSIEIPGNRNGNSRSLQLESHQVLDIYDYMLQARKEIIGESGSSMQNLFVGRSGGCDVPSFVHYMLMKLSKLRKQPKLNPKQIRASVIMKWLKQYNLRQVQYLAGHRYISSTESYQQNEMDGLSEEVSRFHPLD